jgi:thiol-disulfide isomerase/thioredoxin
MTFCQINKIIEDTKTGKPMLIGETTRDAFQNKNFSEWYNSEYTKYEVNNGRLASSKDKIKNKSIKIIMGTWCSDSRREVPRMLKILDIIEFPKEQISIINVDRNKKGLADEVDELNIERIPTFILYEDEKEIGRIIETPEETLEKDLVRITE